MADIKSTSGLDVLNCYISIGEYNADSDILMNERYLFNQCINIEINDSYQTLINTAKVTLPRDIFTSLEDVDENGFRTNRVMASEEITSLFSQGTRIKIRLGYDDNYRVMFDGFIVSVEPQSPLVFHCEDFGWKLKRKIVYPADVISTRDGTIVNDFIDNLLDGTGIALHELTRDMNLKLGTIILKQNMMLSELFEYWKKNFGLLAFIKCESTNAQTVPYLALSRTYFSENNDETLISGTQSSMDIIDFSEHVPATGDKLKIVNFDYNTLALEAVSIDAANLKIKATIITNPSYIGSSAAINDGGLDTTIRDTETAKEKALDAGQTANAALYQAKLDNLAEIQSTASSDEEFLIKNVSSASKKQNKTGNYDIADKFDLSDYNVRTYHEYNVDLETLIKNAKSVFKNISQTGIDGDLTVFGDFGLKSATMVRLMNKRSPEKNGVFIISNVKTNFGVGGYRQTIKIPFKRSN